MSHEPLDMPEDVGLSAGMIDNTGVARMSGALEIKPGKLSVKLPPFLGYVFDEIEIRAWRVQFAGIGDYTPAYLVTHNHTHVLIDRIGDLLVRNVEPTAEEKRMNIYLCDITHPNGFVAALVPKYDSVVQEGNILGDAMRFLDPVIRGCKLLANGSNLHLDIYSGSILIRNAEDITRTSVMDIEADTAISFVRSMLDSVYSATVTAVDPNNYDNGGILTTVPPGLFTVQRIGITHEKQLVIQYGSVLFGSMANALVYITNADINFEIEPGLANGATLAYLAVQQGCTSLQIGGQAQLHKTNNFGEAVEPTGIISSAGALLAANDLSDLSDVVVARTNLGAGSANGLATLNGQGKLTSTQMPFTKQFYGSMGTIKVHSTLCTRVLESVMDNTTSGDATSVRIQFYAEIGDRELNYVIYNDTLPGLITSGVMAVSGFHNVVVAKPVATSVLSVRMHKTVISGTDPIVRGLIISYE